ncbi:NHLP bacteriocin export ABC transporter permease/ATPase subunit [Streptomyces sp. NPDC006660]|uniref:NHLP bacteriocin export ABC transporter permease/ATPase subunit n=1 Tax=Streptomyces sp. NPDC006660 TaxID=3156901 RepID=UPI0033FC5925
MTIAPPPAGAELMPFLTERATPVELTADRFLRFDDIRRVVVVESGAVDLFAVEMRDGVPRGRWTYLNRVERGAILIGTPYGPHHRIVGRPVLGSRLSHLPFSHVESLSGPAGQALPEAEFRATVEQFVRGVEQGIVALAEALRGVLPPREFVPLATGAATEAADGEAIRSVDGVRWVLIEEGHVEMVEGVAGEIGPGTDICVTERDWLIAHGPTRLRSRSVQELLSNGELWGRWVTHAARLLYVIDRRVERGRLAEREALERRRARDKSTLARAALGFESVIRDTEARIKLAEVATDPATLAAARLVASHQGFTVKAPVAGSGHGRDTTELQAIALASGVRTRTVRLDGTWWKQDLGPMIGYRKIGDAPVALLPIGRGYVVAEGARVTPLTREVAGELTNQATVLYRPLPATVKTIGALLRFGFRNNRRDLWTFAVMGVAVSVIGLLVPIMTGAVLGTFVAEARRDLIVQGACVVIASALVVAALSILQNIAVLRIESRSTAAMQVGMWTRLLSLPASFFSRYSTGELGTTVLGISTAQEMLSGMTTTAALGLLTGLANLALVYFYSVWLALLATALVLAGGAFAMVAGYFEVRWQRRLYQHEQRMSSRVFQLLTAIPKLRVTAAEERVFGVWAEQFGKGRSQAASARRVQNMVTTFNAAYPVLCSAILFAVVGGPLGGSVPVAAFLSFFAAFNLLLAASLQFTAAAIIAMGVVPMLEELRPILEAEPEVNDVQADPGDLSGRVALSHVTFRYKEDGPLVLDDVDLSVEPGEFVALVGPSGSGKSTVLRLLLGFEQPSAGSVLYDGQNLAELDVSAVRRQCGVVLQHGALLAGSIKTNIVGSGSYTVEDAWAAAEMAGISADIEAMPMGMNTVLSEGTSTLSGGQRQRLMIARALVARPRIVFFDEATSALDNPTQKMVAESTRRLNASRVVIAHRLSTVADADKIVVMDGGRVVQQGRYEELLADSAGLFARLAQRQMS